MAPLRWCNEGNVGCFGEIVPDQLAISIGCQIKQMHNMPTMRMTCRDLKKKKIVTEKLTSTRLVKYSLIQSETKIRS